jgi:YABBY protein
MKSEIAKVKKANPTIDHKEAFKKAAGNWKTAK